MCCCENESEFEGEKGVKGRRIRGWVGMFGIEDKGSGIMRKKVSEREEEVDEGIDEVEGKMKCVEVELKEWKMGGEG